MSALTLALIRAKNNKPTILELGGAPKPCPFCGGREVIWEREEEGISVTCWQCGASGPARETKWAAASLWQSRTEG